MLSCNLGPASTVTSYTRATAGQKVTAVCAISNFVECKTILWRFTLRQNWLYHAEEYLTIKLLNLSLVETECQILTGKSTSYTFFLCTISWKELRRTLAAAKHRFSPLSAQSIITSKNFWPQKQTCTMDNECRSKLKYVFRWKWNGGSIWRFSVRLPHS